MLDLTLIISKGRVYKCLGEIARDSIDDTCQIMAVQQIYQCVFKSNQSFPVDLICNLIYYKI